MWTLNSALEEMSTFVPDPKVDIYARTETLAGNCGARRTIVACSNA